MPAKINMPSVAIVYDWATTQHGGAEQVLKALHQAFPDAPLITSIHKKQVATWTKNWPVVTTFLQKLPSWLQHHRFLVPLMPLAFETLSMADYGVVISVSSGPAKAVLTKPHQLHIGYILTPPRYLYTHFERYVAINPVRNWLAWMAMPLISYLRRIDKASSLRPDIMVSISKVVAKRVETVYHRTVTELIYPPVSLDIKPAKNNQSDVPLFLCVSRLVEYKRIDLAIKACQKLGYRLVVVGNGPEKDQLQRLIDAKPATSGLIRLVGSLPDHELARLFEKASGFLMPGEEDFGIAAVEAAVRGIPVLLHQSSGAAEIIPTSSCVHITSESVPEVEQGILALLKLRPSQKLVQQDLTKYGTTEFCRRWKNLVATSWAQYQSSLMKGLHAST